MNWVGSADVGKEAVNLGWNDPVDDGVLVSSSSLRSNWYVGFFLPIHCLQNRSSKITSTAINKMPAMHPTTMTTTKRNEIVYLVAMSGWKIATWKLSKQIWYTEQALNQVKALRTSNFYLASYISRSPQFSQMQFILWHSGIIWIPSFLSLSFPTFPPFSSRIAPLHFLHSSPLSILSTSFTSCLKFHVCLSNQ